MGASKKKIRLVRIYHVDGASERLIHVGPSTGLKAALEEYHKHVLAPRGFKEPTFVGNTLTVENQHGHERSYKAVEV